jgi:hypothetical protein
LSATDQHKRRIVFVCRSATGESLRSANALGNLDHVELLGIVERTVGAALRGRPSPETQCGTLGRPQRAAPTVDSVFVDTRNVTNVHDTNQLIAAARSLIEKYGPLDHIITAQETLLEPVAQTREALEIPGMSSATVRQTLDKSLLKSTLRRAGVQTPPDRIVTDKSDAIRFLSEVGFPIMLKPLSGSGALATLLIHTAADLDHALQLMQPALERPVLAETHLQGQELCLDTITIDNEPQLYSSKPSSIRNSSGHAYCRVRWTTSFTATSSNKVSQPSGLCRSETLLPTWKASSTRTENCLASRTRHSDLQARGSDRCLASRTTSILIAHGREL